MATLFEGRKWGVPVLVGNAHVLGVQVEILGICIADPGAIARLPCQPMDKCLHRAKGAIDSSFRQRLAGLPTLGVRQLRLKLHCLFDVEAFEGLEARAAFETQNGIGGLVDRRQVGAPCLAQELQIAPLDGLASADAKMREFLLGVLRAYEALGETELATRKLGDYLTARYGSLADAKAALGDVPVIRKAFVDVQRDLYRN